MTQTVIVNKTKDQEKDVDSKAIFEELKNLREEMNSQNNQYGNSLFAYHRTSRLMTIQVLVSVECLSSATLVLLATWYKTRVCSHLRLTTMLKFVRRMETRHHKQLQ